MMETKMIKLIYKIIMGTGLTVLFALPAFAQKSVGLLIGSPTSINVQFDLPQNRTLETGLAFNMNHSTVFYGDYLFHQPNIFPRANNIQLIYGLGALVAISNDNRSDDDWFYAKKSGEVGLAIRAPFTLEWRPAAISQFGFSFQLAPTLSIFPKMSAGVLGGLGIRFYF